jgi:hypothetical protein
VTIDVLVALIAAVIALAVVAWEIAAFRSAWRYHSISWYAFKYAWVRWLILALFLVAALWWYVHSGHPHPA